jgi:hypothetical protein
VQVTEVVRTFRTRAFVILGLSGLAVAQPLLDLFGRNPEFFIAGRYDTGQIVWFALIVVLVPPLVGIIVVVVASLLGAPVGSVAYTAVVAILATAFALAVLRWVDVDRAVVMITLSLVVGAALTAVVVRTRGGTLFASYLAVVNVVVVASFLFLSPTAELVASDGARDVGRVEVPALRGPVVVVVLDEMPAATIMRADGTLNADRYPGFAKLAAVSTWFRNASSPHAHTPQGVPANLTGTVIGGKDLPTYQDHPRNLFTLLGSQVPVHRYEAVTDLCPPDICAPPPRQPLRQALEDASVVYGHRILPAELRDGLPPIDRSWGAYGDADADADADADGDADPADLTFQKYAKWRQRGDEEKSVRGQAGVLAESIAAITAEPSLHVIHVSLPHRPWTLAPSGRSLASVPRAASDPKAQATDFSARLAFQLHSMQVGAVDVAVGALVDQLRANPTWADTLLVVTSDHGYSLTPPDLGRTVTDGNAEEVYRIPIFIKAPGQVEGDVVDETAQTIDVLPSVIDLLDAQVSWEFDGHSLYDGSRPHTAPRVDPDVDAALAIAAAHAEQFPHGDDWLALAAVGVNGDLVGRAVGELTVGAASEFRVTVDQADQLARLPTAGGLLPLVLTGTVTGRAAADPPSAELVVAVNGTVAGVVGDYRRKGQGWKFTGYVADLYRDGVNELVVYEVERAAGDAILRPTG